MLWFLFFLPKSHADLAREQLKAQICESLHHYRNVFEVETCFNAKFRLNPRGTDTIDFVWASSHGVRCNGTVYQDAGDVHVDGCTP